MIDLKEGAHWSRSLYEFVFCISFVCTTYFNDFVFLQLYSIYFCALLFDFMHHPKTFDRSFTQKFNCKLALPIDSSSKNLGWCMKVNGKAPKHVCNFENFFMINYAYLKYNSNNTLIPIMANNLPKNDWLGEEELIGKNGPQQFDSSLIRPAAAHRKPLWEKTK